MTDTETAGLTKVTVNLTEGSMDALDTTADALGDSRTDTVNRAVQLYAAVTALQVGAKVTFDRAGGDWVTLRRIGASDRLRLALVGVFVIVAAFVAGAVSPW